MSTGNSRCGYFASRSVVIYLLSSTVLFRAFLFAGVHQRRTTHTLLYRLADIEERFIN